jgi:DNA-binding IclR family transcriptional regulator
LSAGEVISIASVDGRHALRISGMLGRRDPIHCSSLGKAILAFLPAREADQLVRECDLKAYTRNTITSRTEFQRELQEIRERGYALDDQELEAGLGCIGAPVHDSSGRVAAAVSIAGAAFRLSPERLPALAHLVVQTAFDLSGRLGYRG